MACKFTSHVNLSLHCVYSVLVNILSDKEECSLNIVLLKNIKHFVCCACRAIVKCKSDKLLVLVIILVCVVIISCVVIIIIRCVVIVIIRCIVIVVILCSIVIIVVITLVVII